ncbi:MAG: CRISPR system precrRNA processing endoribonuclease RAMP protein Cas6, partial [Candidatus Poribacteria bacterium]|nr:CRISPR system precrRNA processing endoribonuclease RAMP protein Cas6 [Candidatus Poribacteria bacterium]
RKTHNAAYLDLVRCYQSWINKWNAFAPIQLDKAEILEFVTTYGQVMRVRSESKRLNFGKHAETGWVGTCACVFYPEDALDTELLRIVNYLAAFAFYCGTGYKTTMGMGQTRRVD